MPTEPHEVYFWPSLDEEPFIATMTDRDAVKMAAKVTSARFRPKAISEQHVLGRPVAANSSPFEKTAAQVAHNLMLGLLNNLSVDYQVIADELYGYRGDHIRIRPAMNKATERIGNDESLQTTFERIQDSYRKQFLGHQALAHSS